MRLIFLLLISAPFFLPDHSASQTSPQQPTAPSKVACVDYAQPESSLPPPGQTCTDSEFAKNGRPVMFPAHNGIAYGVSSTPGKPYLLHFWIDNQTDAPESYLFCCGVFFSGIDVYDTNGRRWLSRIERDELKAHKEGKETVFACSCSATFSVLPHTLRVVDAGNLMETYLLPPGRYTIAEKLPTNSLPGPRDPAAPAVGPPPPEGPPTGPVLTITVP